MRALTVALLILALAAPAASAQEQTASVVLGDPNVEEGLVQIDQADGRTTPVTAGDRSARATAPGDDPSWGRYMYFGLDDEIASDGYYVARVEVEYLDEGTESFGLQYDSNDCTATLNGAYDSAGDVQRTGTGTWKTATFDLPDARFANRENGGSDLRLGAGGSTLTVHRVTVTILEDRTSHPPAPEPGVAKPVEQVSLERSAGRLALDNGYVRAEFDLEHPQIDVIRADFGGRRRYAGDLTAAGAGPLGQSGIVLEREGADGAHASSLRAGEDLRVSVLRDDPAEVVVRIDGIVDDAGDPLVESSWTLALAARERAFRLSASTRALRTAEVRGVRIGAHLSPGSAHGMFERGVVQMMNSPAPDFASGSPLERAYFLGAPGGGAIDVTAHGQRETVLHSRTACGNAPTGGEARTGFELVLAGSHPQPDRWTGASWSAAEPARVEAGASWRTDATIAANGYDFPAGALAGPSANLPEDDLRAIYTAVYAHGGRRARQLRVARIGVPDAGDARSQLRRREQLLRSRRLGGHQGAAVLRRPLPAEPGARGDRALGGGDPGERPDPAPLRRGGADVRRDQRRDADRPEHLLDLLGARLRERDRGLRLAARADAADRACARVHHRPLRPGRAADLGARPAVDRRVHPRELHVGHERVHGRAPAADRRRRGAAGR